MSASPKPGPSGWAGQLDRAIWHLARRHVGAVVGVLPGVDAEPLIAGAGHSALPDGPAPDGDTLFEIGSITKTYTALILAEAVVRGALTLNTPVRDLLPDGVAVPERDGVPITVEHLARHRSGLPPSPEPLGITKIWNAYVRGSNPYVDLSTQRLLDALSSTRLRRTPGTGGLHYSNFGAGLLGVALTHAFGAANYAELVRAAVLEPLRLGDTVGEGEPVLGRRAAQGHALARRLAPNWKLDGLAGAGSLRSTVRDLLRYLRAQLAPESTPLAEAIALTHLPSEPAAALTGGLGWMLSVGRSGRMLWHNGGTGGFRSFAAFLPDEGIAVAAAVNDQRSPDGVAMRLLLGGPDGREGAH